MAGNPHFSDLEGGEGQGDDHRHNGDHQDCCRPPVRPPVRACVRTRPADDAAPHESPSTAATEVADTVNDGSGATSRTIALTVTVTVPPDRATLTTAPVGARCAAAA